MKLEDLLKIVEEFKNLISKVFFQGKDLYWLDLGISIILIGIFLLLAVWGGLTAISQIVKIWTEQIVPLYYNQNQRKRGLDRSRFAEHVEYEVRRLNIREEWKDHRFTELEAEVEAEGKQKNVIFTPFFWQTKRGLRRESSLSKALENSIERLILLEGEPGSGKSIALRHIAEKLSKRAAKSKSINSIIPLYINLKKLDLSPGDKIDRNLIESFIKKEINRVNDRDIENYIEEEFRLGVNEGSWLFLFDSFDEIPEILSSVEADNTIRAYAEAIDDFLAVGFNKCRGIIASRQFRGPKQLGWPQFRILPLENRRLELIKKAGFEPKRAKTIIGELKVASSEIQEMTKNPMFLGILCEDLRNGNPFPINNHSVFENYLSTRINRDVDRLQKKFKLITTDVRSAAENIAFCMSIDMTLGLSPSREEIKNSMKKFNLNVKGEIEQYMNALEYLKLARSEEETVPGGSKLFTFSHRRFQEYFATCIVISDPTRINPRELLTNGRWRETAVVMFQTQPSDIFAPFLAEVRLLIDEFLQGLSGIIENPLAYVEQNSLVKSYPTPNPFHWPIGLFHLLGLLQDGFINRMKDLPEDIQLQAGSILLTASSKGTLYDKKWSLELAGVTPQPILLFLIRIAFLSDSQWLKEVAYRQTARLRKIPDDIVAGIRQSILSLFIQNRLKDEILATYAHLSRLDKSTQYLNILNLLVLINYVDIVIYFVLLFLLVWLSVGFKIPFFFTVTILLLFSYTTRHNYYLFVLEILLRLNISKFYRKINPMGLMIGVFSTSTRLILFPLSWSLFAMIAIYSGQFTHPFWWAFLLLFPIGYFACNFRKFMNMSIYAMKSGWLYFFVTIYLAIGLPLFWMFQNPRSILSIITGITWISFSIFGLFQFFVDYRLWNKDITKWNKWIKNSPSNLTVQELMNLMSLYNHTEFCKKLVIVVREKNLLIITEESKNLINELAIILEKELVLEKRRIKNIARISRRGVFYFIIFSWRASKRKKIKVDRKARVHSNSDFLTCWINEYTAKEKSKLLRLGGDFLDEIYILLEQLDSRQDR
jgi:NACHT domain